MLTSYDGTEITYDQIGNPLNYYTGQAFSWQGRQLVGVVDGSNTYSFTYNDEGIRTSKTKNGVTTTYYLNGTQIMAEETNGNITVYIYDANGAPIGMQYHGVNYSANTWDTYWLEKNLFGDIVAVYDNNGTKLVSYIYDAWGNFTTTVHSNEADAMPYNPFTYRGYYYDQDLELYYLQTRYYDSNTGRFINADGYVTTGQGLISYNMYAYCGNNPITYVDYSGESLAAPITKVIIWGLVLFGEMALAYDITHDQVLSKVVIGLASKAYDAFSSLASAIKSTLFSKAEEKEEVTTAPPSYNTVIYRHGGINPGNLTPSQRDVDLYPITGKGLSFSTVPKPGSAMTTMEALNSTGVVYAVYDGAGHVSVYPIGGTLEDWHNAGSSSIWTKAVKSVVVKWKVKN